MAQQDGFMTTRAVWTLLTLLFASPAFAQTPCTITDKVTTYPNGDKKIGLRCPSTPGMKGDAVGLSKAWAPLTSAALTNALAKAVGGDTIVLKAGVTYAGSFRLGVHPGDDFVTIRTSAELPVGRLADADVPKLAKIVSTVAGVPAIDTAKGAHHWRLLGLDVSQTGGNTYGIIRCGESDGYTSLADVPHHIEIDRVYVHVGDAMQERRGIQMHCNDMTVQRSIVRNIKEEGADSQAVGGWEGTSRMRILDNELQAASEPILFGGAGSSKVTPVPEDIEIRGNYVTKPLAWRGKPWNLKNLLELKNARRVTITDNVFENNWPAAQSGWAILFTARGTATAPWMILEDVTFERNTVKNVSAGVNILGLDDLVTNVNIIGRRFTVRNNRIETNQAQLGGDGWCYMLLGGPNDVVIDGNTCVNDGTLVLAVDTGRPVLTGFQFTDNRQRNGLYGIKGTGANPGIPTITQFFLDPIVTGNVFAECGETVYPAGNTCVTEAQFQQLIAQ
jgi:hypothetical protein